MVDQATQRMVVGASPARTWDVLTDFSEYPRWAHDLKSVTVVERDGEGRGILVRFRAAAMGRSTSYTLRYDYSKAPEVLAWELVEGDLTRKLDGSYELSAVEGEPDRTEVVYDLTFELVVPLPGFVKRRAESRIVHAALRQLRDYLER
jgi:ribosome-associated toxin RatA of RatAB toxin-antitoxin module